jgi:hypothetical protein
MAQHRIPTDPKTCPQCGVVFHRRRTAPTEWVNRIYCGRRCYEASREKIRVRVASDLFAALDSADGTATERYIGPKSTPEYQRQWRAKNKSKVLASAKKRKLKNPNYFRDWARKNRPKLSIRDRKKRLRKYGLTQEGYDRLLVQQGNRCAICLKPALKRSRYKHAPLDVDHCHRTNTVRGLLCFNCNSILGNARDSVEVLRAAIGYLERICQTDKRFAS